ncbi:MAG: hypothetical protein ACE5GT_11645 [Rhodospirillales bacterium]
MVSKGLAIGLVALFLSACGPASPYVIDQPQPDEIPPGRGLFTGKDGEYVLWGSSKSEEEEQKESRRTDSSVRPVSSVTTPYNRPAVAAPVVQSRAGTSAVVHFASYGTVELAERRWSQIWSDHWRVLSGVQPYIDYASVGGSQPRYHLYGKGLTKEQAEDLCWNLQLRKEYCAVINF